MNIPPHSLIECLLHQSKACPTLFSSSPSPNTWNISKEASLKKMCPRQAVSWKVPAERATNLANLYQQVTAGLLMESVGQHILWVYWQLCPPGFKWFHCQVWGAQWQNTPETLKSAPPELLISFPEAFSNTNRCWNNARNYLFRWNPRLLSNGTWTGRNSTCCEWFHSQGEQNQPSDSLEEP